MLGLDRGDLMVYAKPGALHQDSTLTHHTTGNRRQQRRPRDPPPVDCKLRAHLALAQPLPTGKRDPTIIVAE